MPALHSFRFHEVRHCETIRPSTSPSAAAMTNDRVTSFTHSCEDVLLLRALADVEVGFYIDVGACDPVMDSVTKAFYDRGWCGLNLEPNPAFLHRLRQDRPRDSNLGVAASDHAGTAEFTIVEDTGLSALDAAQARLSAAGAYAVRTISVETETLATLWDTWVPAGQPVHFLKIDVEGAEQKVIFGADWKRHRPWILVIEATVPRTVTPSHSEWEPAVLDAGYVFAFFDGLNRYYVAQEKRGLLAAFDWPANPAIDNFKPFSAELVERKLQGEIDRLSAEMLSLSEAQNADLLRMHRQLEDGNNLADDLRRQVGQLQDRARKLGGHAVNGGLAQPWRWIVFCSNGRPRSLFRWALFHDSGKPRDEFSDLVLKPDGMLHAMFRAWMTSPDYQRLPAAVRLAAHGVPGAPGMPSLPGPDLSPRARDLLESLERRAQNVM